MLRLAEMTWAEARELDRARAIAILPVGATEAHGPHLPLATDGIIAEAMAADGARLLLHAGWPSVVLPTLEYVAAPFAAAFPGTVSVRPETLTTLVADIAASLADQGFRTLAIANAHLDPTHLGSLHAAVKRAAEASPGLRIVFPDLTRKPWALRLGDEFKTGACHAGRYETSVVMAARPDLVREGVRAGLAANPSSLSAAIGAGQKTFEEAGGPHAYFGWPADATADEGRTLVSALGGILAEAVFAAVDPAPESAPSA
ncbi:MAG: creatininase family protein [bacterium]